MVFRSVLLAIALVAVPAASLEAPATNGDVPLRSAADQLGLSYAWLGPETAVALSRPGLVIVIHPGQAWFQVNDATETTATPPRFVQNDVYVSRDLFARLQRIAQTPSALGPTSERRYAPSRNTVTAQVPPSGAGSIVVNARSSPGAEAIDISGKITPSGPVTLTLWTTISRDLPTIVVNRQVVAPDHAGNFQTTMSIAPSFYRGSLLKIVASVPGISSATADVIVREPNAGVTGPADQIPSNVK
jgi:hypothetical protein